MLFKIVWNINLAWGHLIAHISGHHLAKSLWNYGVRWSSILVVYGWQVHIRGIQYDYGLPNIHMVNVLFYWIDR